MVFTSLRPRERFKVLVLKFFSFKVLVLRPALSPSFLLQPLQQLGCVVGDDDVSTCVGRDAESCGGR